MSEISRRTAALQGLLEREGLYAWVSLTCDPHCSEYVPARWETVKWLTGFSGSSGAAVVTRGSVLLWTDSRYWTQAASELSGTDIVLMKDGGRGVPGWNEWLAASAPRGGVVAMDGECTPCGTASGLEKLLSAKGVKLSLERDLPGEVWKDRPAVPDRPVYEASLDPTPRSAKLSRLRAMLREAGAAAFASSALDEVCWLTNLRGSDIPYNPVFLSHVIVTEDKAVIFADRSKFSSDTLSALAAGGFTVAPYAEFREALGSLPAGGTVLYDPAAVSEAARRSIRGIAVPTREVSPISLLKTRKTPGEIALIDEAMAQDGAALCRFYARLEKALSGSERLTELSVSRMLLEERSRAEGFIGESFETITAVGPHAALPHYAPSEKTDAPLEGDTVLLIDSGAHYQGGTTDITRVTPINRPPEAAKRDYTAVLRGHLALLDAYFPEGAYASQLDTIARIPLWETDADYGHGTGHGVGFFLCVHERPYSISPRGKQIEATKTVEGVVVSDEPGLYREGRWGIRIESLVTPVPAASSEFGRFMTLRPLTLCPIDTRLIVPRMMRPAEIAVLNSYHRRVRERLRDLVSGNALDWLLKRTETF